MSEIYNRIRMRRQELGWTTDELAKRMGYKDRSSISKIESGKADIPQSKVKAFADVLDTTVSWLLGIDANEENAPNSIPPGFQPLPAMTEVPLVGRIACGTPITAEENIERMVCVPAKWRATFTLTCEGSSMEPKIHDGDLVAIRSQPTVENGEVAAVRIDGEATLKRVYLHENFIELRAENPDYTSIILTKEEMNTVTIEGKAVGLCRDI